MMSCMARIPNLVRRGRHAKAHPNANSDTLTRLKDDVQSLDAKFAPSLISMRHRLHMGEVSKVSTVIAKVFGAEALRALYLRMYALGLATEILIVLLLKTLKVDTAVSTERLKQASHEMIGLADEAAQWLPLGAMSMVPCMTIAWVGARDADTRHALDSQGLSYAEKFRGKINPSEGPQYLKRIERRLAFEST